MLSEDEGEYQIVVLGAGKPKEGDVPSALWRLSPHASTLQWQADAYGASLSEFQFVAGFAKDEILDRYPELNIVENESWQDTGNVMSLLSVALDPGKPLFVSYSDVIFRRDVVRRLDQSTSPVAIAYTKLRHHSIDTGKQLAHKEYVTIREDRAIRLGYDIPEGCIGGEFAGIVRFSPRIVAYIQELQQSVPENFKKSNLTDLLEYLRLQGVEIETIDTFGDWAEIEEHKDVAQFILGTKAESLFRLREMVSRSTILDQVAFTVADWAQNQDDIRRRARALSNPGGDGYAAPLIVRSSARSEDTFYSSNAGGYDSVLNIDSDHAFVAAVDQVIGSYFGEDPSDQVLVQPMVNDVAMSGVIFTRTIDYLAPWYVINYETTGRTDGITSGDSNDHHTLFVHRGSDAAGISDPAIISLLQAIAEIEQVLSYDALDIEFAINAAGTVYILQVRPLATGGQATAHDFDDNDYHDAISFAKTTWQRLKAPPPHFPNADAAVYGIMPDWNPAEIIGTAPGALSTSLYRHIIMDSTWATQRAEYGYHDVRPAPLLVEFCGHPYVDVRASFFSFIPATLDMELAEKLLSYYLNRLRMYPEFHDKVEFEIVPTCLAPDFGRWEKLLQDSGRFTESEVAQLRDGLGEITRNAFARTRQDLDQLVILEQRRQKLAGSQCDPIEAVRILLDDCRRFGALPFAHLARSGFVAITLLSEAQKKGIISGEAREAFLSSIRTVSHELTEDASRVADAQMQWPAFVEKYGHLRPGTYEITSPRYDSDPEKFLRPLIEQSSKVHADADSTLTWERERALFCDALADIGLPSDPTVVETFLREAIEGREFAKFVFSRSLSDGIETLAQFGAELGLTREDLSNLPLDELLALRCTSASPGYLTQRLGERSAENQRRMALANAIKLPSIITRAEDFDAFYTGSDIPNFVGSASIMADCCQVLSVEGAAEPNLNGVIALIPQADPGYDWLFGQGIAGLVTMYGGANSHMAIRAAEFKLPAAIGIGEQRYNAIASATVLLLDPGNQILRVVR